MSNDLSFVIWSAAEDQAPQLIKAGTAGSFSDGHTIELMSKASDSYYWTY